jgi:hypothetical protein
VLATVRLVIVGQIEWASILECPAADTDVESIAAARFHCANWIGVIAISLVEAVYYWSGCAQRLIPWRLGRCSCWSRLATACWNVDPGFADFQIGIEV